MNNLTNNHLKLLKLVQTGVLIPGIYTGEVGNIRYSPISLEEYLQKLNSGNVQDLAYNTKTMGRGIFTLDEEDKIINFKGVDSHLENSDSIAIQSTEGTIDNVNGQDSYGINIIRFIDRSDKYPDGKSRLEFRVKGASQFQNLLVEKLKRDDIKTRDLKGLIKVPDFDLPKPLSKEMCEDLALPRVIEVTDEFLQTLKPGSYADYCVKALESYGIQFTERNQLWTEYFQEYHPEKLQSSDLFNTIQKEDSTYGLGAIFGQTTRKLDTPFRIMELDYYIKSGNTEAVRAIINYSESKCNGKLLEEYSKIAAKNAAGFMNLNLAMNNFEHRQDYPLSGEICDDAYDDVNEELNSSDPKVQYIAQLRYKYQPLLFATNMKIIEDAYKIIGKKIPQGYQELFVKTFYDSLDNKENFKLTFRSENPIGELNQHENNVEKNFSGMKDYLMNLRKIAIKEYNNHITISSNDEHDDRDEK